MANSLADSFPADYLDEMVSKIVKVGNIFKIIAKNIKPLPKEKYHIIIGQTTDVIFFGTLFINTKQPRKDSYLLKSEIYKFLKYDSFVDCSIIHEVDAGNLINKVKISRDSWVGCLQIQDIENIKEVILRSKTISLSDKKKFNLIKNY